MRIRLTHKTEKLAPIWVTRVTSDGQLLANIYGKNMGRNEAANVLRAARKNYKEYLPTVYRG